MCTEFVMAETREAAESCCPLACWVIEVDGGWMCFESVRDAQVWERQA